MTWTWPSTWRTAWSHQGRLIAEGDVETIRNHPQVNEIYLGVD